jgi:hypothetical protein
MLLSKASFSKKYLKWTIARAFFAGHAEVTELKNEIDKLREQFDE